MKNKSHQSAQKIAFFSLPKGLSQAKRRKRELELWGHYCANGGDPTAIPHFHDFGLPDGFVSRPTLDELRTAVMNKSRHQAKHAR